MNEFMRQLLALPPQASTLAPAVDYLHYFVIGVTMLGAVLTFLVALIFVVRYRRKRDELTPPIKISVWVEASWIGALLVLFCLWWVLGYRLFIQMTTPPPDSMEVYVTAKQWMWKFAYPNGKRAINVLTVPVNRPVRLTMTSRDVIHSFSVPAFRLKMDVVPGTYTTTWFQAVQTGSFQILCAEYCGVSHSNMWARVDVLSAEDYERWLDAQREDGTDDMYVQGREVAVRHGCVACHTFDGRRHLGPSFGGLYGREVRFSDGTTRLADAAYLTESMMDPRAQVVEGFAPIMPTYHGLLSAGETAALVELIRSLSDVERGGTFP
jgi:cytochrome c oxidase subunit 2